MKIKFINPKHHPHSMNFLHCLDIVGVKYSHMPLSLPTLAALTPPDCTVEIEDENAVTLNFETDADIVALTGSVPQRKRVFELAGEFRRRGKPVVIGGPITFDMPDECAAHADVVFIGEAEYTWPVFIEDFRQGKHRNLYHQKEWINMEDSPMPHFHHLKSAHYASGCVQVTRGCPNRCDFCDIPVKYGGQPRSKKPEQVLKEIMTLSGLGYDSVFIVDDNFAGNKPYAKSLLKKIAEMLPALPTKMYFYTQATLDAANDDELLELFRSAAFLRLFIGIETGDRGKLNALNKKHQADIDVKNAVSKIKSYGITVWGGLLLGLEDDDLLTFEKQYEFIRDADFLPIQVGLLQAVPGTPLYSRAVAENRFLRLPSIYGLTALSEEELSKATNLLPKNMSEAELEMNFARILRKIFSPESFREKMIQYIRSNTRNMTSSLPSLNIKTVMIVMRLLSYYLFRADGKTRKMFFKVLRTLAANSMRNLDETVFHLLAYKHMQTHYYKIADICESRR